MTGFKILKKINAVMLISFSCDRYDSEGKGTSMASVASSISPGLSKAGVRSFHSDRVFLSHITEDPSLGQDKV